jgi:NAD(P)-dependent dehydrogenase (short-subunit alcohol dehydrogenase family)
MARLGEKVALVTGAARGIGRAIAAAFVREGAWVWVTDVDGDGAARTASELGPSARAWTLDVRDEAAWSDAMRALLSEHGRLDVLVNNAGITGFEDGFVAHDPEHATLEAWRAVHATNLDGVFLGCKHAIRAMRPRGQGSIINVSSRSGVVGIPAAAAYASSKAAVRNHTKSVALHCAATGTAIRCNSIHPAAILTAMWEPMLGREEPARSRNAAALVRDVPLKRFGQPEEVAAIAILLASDEATYLTGAELHIDGGILAGAVAAPTQEDA